MTMKDPYMTLGVSRNATDEEIKKAYRTLARKYHPDNYAGSDLADVAEEKMKEINEAYDMIGKMRSAGGSGGSYTGGSSSQGYTSGNYAEIRYRINEGRFSDAEILLDAIPASQRGAEWNFLKGCVMMQRGYYFDAQKYIETACYLDPTNMEYRQVKQRMRATASSYDSPYRTTSYGSACSGTDCCTSLICADCLCECCGGDLIRCC